jgi:comEA protein
MRGNVNSASPEHYVRSLSSTLIIALTVLFGVAPVLAQKSPPAQPINLNTATIAQLETLPGIGPNTAKSIIDFRNRSGPFQRIEDLLAIKGISKSKLEKLRPYVTVGPAAPNRHPDSPHQVSSSPNFQKAM